MDACRAIIWVLVVFAHWARQGSEQQAAVLDQHCISWTLRTSLDGPIRLLTMSYLTTLTPADPHPTLVLDCLDILFGCVKVIEREVVVTQGMEQLATASALCFLHMLSHLTTMDPPPRVLENALRRYTSTFDAWIEIPASPAFSLIHHRFYGMSEDAPAGWLCQKRLLELQWDHYNPSNNEHAIILRASIAVARSEYERIRTAPSWLLRFVVRSLSRSPPPSISVAASCLSIIAIDLGCDLPRTAILDERCVRV